MLVDAEDGALPASAQADAVDGELPASAPDQDAALALVDVADEVLLASVPELDAAHALVEVVGWSLPASVPRPAGPPSPTSPHHLQEVGPASSPRSQALQCHLALARQTSR